MHIGKTGGTAIKRTLHSARLAYRHEGGADKVGTTPFGPIKLETHRFRLEDLPDGDHVFFCVRDPVDRFLSGFHSRFSRGGQAYGNRFGWSEDEEKAFARFDTPNRLALALCSDDAEEREFAQWAMKHIRHVGFQRRFTGSIDALHERSEQIVYIARQETLTADWERLKQILALPPGLHLVNDPGRAHRRTKPGDAELDAAAVRNLREWYAHDYGLLEVIEEMRAKRGWDPGARLPPVTKRLRRTAGRARRRIAGATSGRAR
jgi:hypothetical protein